jgi:glycosyltransferase involved in cell wall biosynthesis
VNDISPMIKVPPESRAIVLSEIEAMGGAERSVVALSRWLMNQGLPHHFVTYVDRIDLSKHVDHPITVVQLRPTMRPWKKISVLRRYFAARRGSPAPLMSAYQPALHATLAGIRGFHCLLHDTPSLLRRDKSRLRQWGSDKIAAHGLKSGGRTMVTSEYLRQETMRAFGVEADIVRMGGLTSENAFLPRRVTDELRMLSVSRVEGNKRIDWIIRALAALEREATPLSSRINWSLDIAGTGSHIGSLRELSAALGLAERVHLLGYVSDAVLDQLYGRAHLFLMPAVQGYGIPAIEALARGIPVLLHRDSGVSDILRSTPWATVIEGSEAGLLPGLRKAIDATLAGTQSQAPLPELPTEDQWAERVSKLCGWA